MFFAEPQRTPYDLEFRLGGIPVRVHPLFWLVALILGATGASGDDQAIEVILWIMVMFVSILVHEMGHALTMLYFGQRPRVVLYMMGGLAIADSMGPSFGGSQNRSRDQILISLAGPGAGFVLAGLTILVFYLSGMPITPNNPLEDGPWWTIHDVPENLNPAVLTLGSFLLFINVFWGLMNLLPVYPLDGGQVARELFVQRDAWNGVVNSLKLSVITGAACAVAGWLVLQSIFMALLFGSLAFSSYQALQQFGGGKGGGRPW